MSNTPYFSSTAYSTPYSEDISKLGVTNIQDAIDKLALLMSATDTVDDDGNFIIKIGVKPENIIIASDVQGTIYNISVSDYGELVSDSSHIPTSIIQNFRLFKKSNGSFAKITVADDGTVAVIDAFSDPYTANLQSKSKLFLKSPNGSIWLFGITDLNEIFLETGLVQNGCFKIINQQDQLLFGVTTQPNYGLSYLPVFTKDELPVSPPTCTNNIPWSFLLEKNGGKVPVFFDGTAWRYFSNNGLVCGK